MKFVFEIIARATRGSGGGGCRRRIFGEICCRMKWRLNFVKNRNMIEIISLK